MLDVVAADGDIEKEKSSKYIPHIVKIQKQ